MALSFLISLYLENKKRVSGMETLFEVFLFLIKI